MTSIVHHERSGVDGVDNIVDDVAGLIDTWKIIACINAIGGDVGRQMGLYALAVLLKIDDGIVVGYEERI